MSGTYDDSALICPRCHNTGAPRPGHVCQACADERDRTMESQILRDQARGIIPDAHDHWARRHATDDDFRGRYKHVPGIGWRRWDGIGWADGTNEILRQHFDAVKTAYTEISARPNGERANMTRALIRAANVPFAEGTLKAMAAMPMFHADAGAFDSDPRILVTPAGVVNCDSLARLPHSSARLVMRCTTGSHNPAREDGTRWAQFMSECFPDPAMCAFMRRLLGYIVFGDRERHLFPIFAGDGGNGKSVMVDTLVSALGDYASVASADLLLWTKNDKHPAEKMVLHGRRLVAASELPEGRRLNEALVKSITGSAQIRARHLYKSEISFPRTWVPTLDTNHKPRIDATDDAIWQRVILIEFTERFRGTPREEPGLTKRLCNSPDDVLSWCAAGWRDYQERGSLAYPKAVRDATKAYQADQDTLGAFLDDSRAAGFTYEEFSRTFIRYQNDSGVTGVSKRKFRKLLEERGLTVKAGAGNVLTVWY